MNNDDQAFNQPSSEERKVRVYCTRPRLSAECIHPHISSVLETNILKRDNREQQICGVCGMPLLLGDAKRYVPIEKLGNGGFGVTFVAIDTNIGSGTVLNRHRRVIKQLCPEQKLSPAVLQQVQERFRREAQVLANLHHPNIPALFDYFEEEASDSRISNISSASNESNEPKQTFFYLVQQYIDGIDLEAALKQRGAFPEQEVERFLKILLSILNDIHSGSHHSSKKSIIHRDIKPANIICSTKEVVKEDGTTDRVADLTEGKFHLIDFGTVKEVVQVVEQQVPSEASAIVCFGFSPPEQIARKPVGFFSDIYALGATCVTLLTAENPDNLGVPYNLSAWKERASVSPKFAAILDKMLSPSPDDRYQCATEVLQDLDKLVPPPPPPPPPPRNLLPTLAASALGLLVLAAVGVGTGVIPFPTNHSFGEEQSSLISMGDKPLANNNISLNGTYKTLKQDGMEAFADGDYKKARDTFADIRRIAKKEWNDTKDPSLETPYGKALQDPTVLIYQNNAEVRLRHKQGEPIYTIAAAIPLNINIGREMLFGIAQAQDQAVNPQNGEAPINLEIVLANDGNDPEQAERVAKSLTENLFDGRRILAVIGHYTSDSTCAALKTYYAPANVPVISPLSTAANLREDCNGGNWFFRTTSSTKIEAATLVDYLIMQIPRAKVAIFYNKKDTFSRNLFNQFQSILNTRGGEAVETFDLSDEIDIEAVLNRVKDEVDALAVLPDGRTRTDIPFKRAVEIIKANQGEKLIVGSNPLYNQSVINEAGGRDNANVKNKLILATDWYRECEPNSEGSFVEQAEQDYWFGGVNRTTALSYEAVQVVVETLAPGITSSQIQQKLTTGSPESAVFDGKTISFKDGDRIELAERILTTPGDNPRNPFALVQGCPD